MSFLSENRDAVFFSRQLEVLHEHRFFHWITNRALRSLIERGELVTETRALAWGGDIKLVWHRTYRYYRRSAIELIRLVEEYAHPNIGAALGLHGEMMVLEGFARNQFVLLGREINEFQGRTWRQSEHNVDLLFERDGYGTESR